MNRAIVFISILIFMVLIHLGSALKTQREDLCRQASQWQDKNKGLMREIKYKGSLSRRPPVILTEAYNRVMNQIRSLGEYGQTGMKVQLEDPVDSQDIASRYQQTVYQGIRGVKIKISVDKISSDTDMGTVLDDIHLLEQNTDFLASQIIKDNNNLIVKGEIYGL